MDFAALFDQQPALLSLVNAVASLRPPPVQHQALTGVAGAADVLMQAPTGSGKTLAFLLRSSQLPGLGPVADPRVGPAGCRCGQRYGLESVLIHGGTGREPQLAALQTPPWWLLRRVA